MYKYETVPGFFAQDNPDAVPTVVGALPKHFGLSLDSWATFRGRIDELNNNAAANESYKVFFFGRHGQGHHNVAEARYGTKAWDDYWSRLNGDGKITWGPDPELTRLGETQAREAAVMWKAELSNDIPFPQAFYCSPMIRAIRTYQITFSHLGVSDLPKALILENCREKYGEHTCDRRRTRSYLLGFHDTLLVEDSLTEDDEFWLSDKRETEGHIESRAQSVLDHVFAANKHEKYISVTAHGGIINGFLHVMGRLSYALPTGGVLPVVIRQIES